MPKETFRSYFGFHTPKHRKSRSSRSLKIVTAAAALIVGVGVVFTLVHHAANSQPSSTSSTTTISTSGSTGNAAATSSRARQPSRASTTTTISAPPTPLSPSKVLVEVFNGSGVTGQAGSASSSLAVIGFQTNGIADAASFTYTASVIEYPPGQLDAAKTLRHYIGGTTTLESSSSVASGQVWLITGSDFTGITGS